MPMLTLLILFVSISLFGKGEYYRAYDYNDTHNITVQIQDKRSLKQVILNTTLHIRSLEHNQTEYMIVWLEDIDKSRKDIDPKSIYAPFIFENLDKDGLKIGRVQSLSIDAQTVARQIGIVDVMQFVSNKSGIFHFRNAYGIIEVNQSIDNKIYNLKYLHQFHNGKLSDDVTYLKSAIKISPDKNSSLFSNVSAYENVKLSVKSLNANMYDSRMLYISPQDSKLDKNHWFLHLDTNISNWSYPNYELKKAVTFQEAQKQFAEKYRKLKILAMDKDDKKFEDWLRENIDFLDHLSELLETHSIDDSVSKKLFSRLGFIDTQQSAKILSEVFLNDKIDNKERFRSLMGLKNTTAPLQEEQLQTLIDYGLGENQNQLQKSSGMLLGAMARHRVDRAPEQFKLIAEHIEDNINRSEDKIVALSAAGNMRESAPESVVESVESILINNPSPHYKAESARVISQMNKTSLLVSDFQAVLESASNEDVKAQLIHASTVAKDFNSNDDYKKFIYQYANNKKEPKKSRLSALQALQKSGFGKTSQQKSQIRTMMLGESDRDIIKQLKSMYR